MTLKGHATIELKNQRTGEVQKIEEDNFITNFFKDAIQPFGRMGDIINYYDGKTMDAVLSDLTKGVVLFDQALPEDPDAYTNPEGVNMVGRASDYAYNGNDETMGSYNEAESVTTNDGTKVGYKYVFDFSTQQANGTIGSICLCPPVAAKIGFGKGNKVVNNGTNFIQREISGKSYNHKGISDKYSKYFIDAENNRVLMVTSGFGTDSKKEDSFFVDHCIVIGEYRFPVTNRSVFDSYNGDEIKNASPDALYTINMPEELVALCDSSIYQNFNFDTREENGKGILSISILPEANGSISAGANIYIWKIDLSTMTSTVETYVNSTGEKIGGNYYNYPNYQKIIDLKDYLLLFTNPSNTGKKLFTLNKSTGECRRVKKMDGTDVMFGSSSNDYFENKQFLMKDGNMVYGSLSKFSESEGGSTFFHSFFIDCTISRLKYLNHSTAGGSLFSPHSTDYEPYKFAGKRKHMWKYAGTSYLFPLVLFTINNLSIPVEKSNEQTMKITYELTKV